LCDEVGNCKCSCKCIEMKRKSVDQMKKLAAEAAEELAMNTIIEDQVDDTKYGASDSGNLSDESDIDEKFYNGDMSVAPLQPVERNSYSDDSSDEEVCWFEFLFLLYA
jgi:hypothetical protein